MGSPMALGDGSSAAGCSVLAVLIESGEPSERDMVMSGAVSGIPEEWLAGAAIVGKYLG